MARRARTIGLCAAASTSRALVCSLLPPLISDLINFTFLDIVLLPYKSHHAHPPATLLLHRAFPCCCCSRYSNFEGGIRVNAFASGGALPAAVQGSKLEGTIHIADWYRTFANMAGQDPTDHVAAASNLPPIDSLDVWPMLSGANLTSPRENIGIIVTKDLLVLGDWKYALPGTNMIESDWGGPAYPNATTETSGDTIDTHSFVCPSTGCLYNVVLDPEERNECSAANPEVAAHMDAELKRQAAGMWNQPHPNDPACKKAAYELYGGFYGPWLELED